MGQDLTISSDVKINALTRPSKTIAELKEAGFDTLEPAPSDIKAFPMKLDAGNKDEYWIGFNNFYVISRYNPRIKYAMAVYQLRELIQNEYCAIKSKC